MEIIIHASKLEVTDAIRQYIESKVEKINKYFKDKSNIRAKVNLRLRGIDQIIEITVFTDKFTLRSEVTDKDLYAATDMAVDKLERQIRKNKTRLNNKYKSIQLSEIESNLPTDVENEEKIVKRKDLDSKPMDEEEAILQMEMLNHDFFVFKNAKEDNISVVYKRKDGHYGIMSIK